MRAPKPVHVCHIILRLGYGGMENGLVTIVSRLRGAEFRHTILCIEDATEFRERVPEDVPVYCLGGTYKGQIGKLQAVRRALREIRPDVVHTRNLPTIDLFPAALAAGVRRLVHSEHGVDMLEIDGSPLKYRLTRRAGSLFTSAYIALSNGLRDWMVRENGIPRRKISVIINGVDTERFSPTSGPRRREELLGRLAVADAGVTVFGSLGRLEPVKDHENLARAFVAMVAERPDLRTKAVLVIGGDGSRWGLVEAILQDAGLRDRLWMLGAVSDTPAFYKGIDVFVLPSKSEGTSNTILEAMASGLPIIATSVGENGNLVEDCVTGALVPPEDPASLAKAMAHYVDGAEMRAGQGAAARKRALDSFGIDGMVASYADVYRRVLA